MAAIRLLLMFAMLPVIATSQSLFQLDQYTLRDGLPQSQVNAVAEDFRGRLWVATNGGLSCFDGVSFQSYFSADGLPDERVMALLPDGDRMIIGTQRGVVIFDGQTFTAPEGLGEKSIQSLLKFAGRYWVGTDAGLYSADNLLQGRWDVELEQESVFDLCVYNNRVAAACDNGVVLIHPSGESVLYSLPSSRVYANALLVDRGGDLLVGTYGKGVLFLQGEALVSHPRYMDAGAVVFDFYQGEDGTMFVATLKQGVAIYRESGMQRLDNGSGLGVNAVSCLSGDRWSNVWLGTSGGGLVRMSLRPFSHFGRDQGLPADPIYAVAQTPSGVVVSCSDQGLFRLEEGRFRRIDIAEGMTVKALFQDREGNLWIGTEGSGMLCMTTDSVYTIDYSNGLAGAYIKVIQQDKNGIIWAGTAGGGVAKVVKAGELGSWNITMYTQGMGLAEDRITDLQPDHRGNIWYSTPSSGMGVILASGDILNFNTEHGLPGLEVRSLTLDEAHFLWIGGATGWVSSIDLGAETYEFRNIALKDPLPPLFTVQADKNQNLWVGTSKGVYRWKFDANRLPLVTEHFGRAEGFEGIEVCTNAVVACDNGSVWFGTVAGVSVSNPSSEDVTLKPPVVYIDQPHLFYRSFSELPLRHYINRWSEPADTLVLTMDQNHLSFSLHAINLQLPEDILFSHFLEGMEDTWSPFDENTTVSYSNLPPGTYTLRVRACVRGQACAEARPVNIRILAPFWQKTWFILCALIGGLLVLVLAFVIAVKRVKQRAKEKNERLRLERDVIDLEQKALRLQMNPHFIFNTLNSIQGLIAQQDNKTARLYLARFSRLMREILENSREDVITFEEEFETLKTYVELHKFTLNVPVELEIDCDDELLDHPLPPLLLQPFVENAILHGIVPQGEGRISIRAAVREKQVEITIEDNGIGRAASAANKPFSHKSAGLEVTRSRLSLLHASDNAEFFTVSDVIPHGTRVSILLPLVRG